MQEYGTTSTQPVLLIHGGAGPRPESTEASANWTSLREQITAVCNDFWPEILNGMSATQAASQINAALELLPDFNAGKGSFLQNDGQARMSASLMDGEEQKFTGVHLVTHLLQPSRLVLALQERKHTVFGPLGAQLLARELGIEPANPVTLKRIERWRKYLEDKNSVEEKGGTVGAIVLDTKGRLASATSTGGDVSNPPQRMSDSATVAGNYASVFAAISCTGVGEQIVDDAVAARIETRVRDGKSVIEASKMMTDEAEQRQRFYGWIGLDAKGNWSICHLCDDMIAVVMTNEHERPFVLPYVSKTKPAAGKK